MTDEEAKSKLKELLSTVDYTEFVEELAVSANDQKIRNLLDKKLTKGEPFYVRKAVIGVTKLRPMQNEIDTTKSLQYPLTNIGSCKAYFEKGPVIIKMPLFTFDGKYIVDGHHRWSQVFCINPEAEMACYDLLAHLKPLNVLKIIQVKIAADTGNVKVATVEGSNLLDEDIEKMRKYMDSTMTPEVDEFLRGKYGVKDRDGVINKIISNIKLMRKTSQPISGAPERGVMPQTDAVPSLASDVAKGDLGQGALKKFSTIQGRDSAIDHLYELR